MNLALAKYVQRLDEPSEVVKIAAMSTGSLSAYMGHIPEDDAMEPIGGWDTLPPQQRDPPLFDIQQHAYDRQEHVMLGEQGAPAEEEGTFCSPLTEHKIEAVEILGITCTYHYSVL